MSKLSNVIYLSSGTLVIKQIKTSSEGNFCDVTCPHRCDMYEYEKEPIKRCELNVKGKILILNEKENHAVERSDECKNAEKRYIDFYKIIEESTK